MTFFDILMLSHNKEGDVSMRKDIIIEKNILESYFVDYKIM